MWQTRVFEAQGSEVEEVDRKPSRKVLRSLPKAGCASRCGSVLPKKTHIPVVWKATCGVNRIGQAARHPFRWAPSGNMYQFYQTPLCTEAIITAQFLKMNRTVFEKIRPLPSPRPLPIRESSSTNPGSTSRALHLYGGGYRTRGV